jgi:uncharacterized membrane protein YdjX (TVP38/TMEM64 family)
MSELAAHAEQSDDRETDEQASPSFIARHAGLIRVISIIALILGVFLIMRTLPVGEGITRMEAWIESLGGWGPAMFALIYVIAAVAMIPGGLLTIAAGAIFGLLWGFIAVSIGSTIGAALAFLIGRYFARNTVKEQTAKYPKFAAVDRAIDEGGWRIIAMLRLVPLFPFNVGNYLLGLTPVKFWHYVLASWIAMMPGTLVYVYLGHVGRKGVEAAAGEAGLHPLEWVLMIVGFLVAVAVTVYITKLAKRKLDEQTELDLEAEEEQGEQDVAEPTRAGGAVPVKTLILAGVAAVTLVLGACATLRPDWLTRLFGPPVVVMAEVYEVKPDGPTFDHSLFDQQLQKYVSDEDGGGWIDYAAWKANDREALQKYIRQLGEADFDALGRNEKLALLINAYNAFTIELIFEYWDDGNLKSIRDIPSDKRWDHQRWHVGDNVWSLNQIEHEQIRPKFKEPRIHWAVVCAAIGCPPLRTEAYTGEKIDEQLDDQGRIVHSHERWARFDREDGVIHLTKLYEWYTDDYEQVDGGILEHAAKYMPDLREDLEAGKRPRIRFLHYDWDLNHRPHVKENHE